YIHSNTTLTSVVIPYLSIFIPSFQSFFFYCYVDHRDLHSFPTRRSSDLNQYLPSCQAYQRDGGCLFHGEILGLQRHVSFIHGDEFGERTDPVLMRPRINFVPRLEPSHFGPGTDDDPGHVVAENQRQAIGQNVFELAVPNLGIQLVYTGCVDLDQYIIVPDFRIRHFAETYGALAFIAIDDECLHGLAGCGAQLEYSQTQFYTDAGRRHLQARARPRRHQRHGRVWLDL